LIYVGTGNAVPVLGGEVRAGNNLYMTSVVALEVSSGKLKWYRQLTHHDLWEMDLSTPLILYDARVAGKSRKAVAVMRTDGYLFVFDRATGEPLVPIQERAVPQDLRVHTAPTQPFPAGTDQIGPNCVEADMLPPGFVSGCYFEPLFYDHPEKLVNYITVRQAPMSFDPQTGYFYVAGGISPWWYRRPENPFITQATHPPGAKEYGLVAAIDSRTHKIAWQARSPWMLDAGSGIMTTAGGLMFRMEGDGNFLAFDAKTGKQLWKFQTGYVAGPTVLSLTGGAPSAAYEVDGQEYIVVGMGKGLWAFSLHGSVSEHPAPPVPPTKYGFQGIVQPLDSGGEIGMSMLRLGAGPQGQEHYVDHSGFNPVRARIAAGQPVKFTNYGVTTRTVVSADGSWTTGPVAPGQSVSVTIDKPGKYRYFATESPWSRGELLVQ
jgi:alcohol dehydrogenase (cytochrome c)